ncbi:MAG: endonuclease/exonuclease/phosphatase family protein [Candidatus Hydrogenedentes bacterium]|nr:endonuclease/exonuclease/phosphatase family protein [Candidatus Hydrogenedentota bacterium]
MLNRRGFLRVASAGVLASAGTVRAGEKERLWRTISYNVLGFRGYPNLRRTRERLTERRERHPELTAKALEAFSPAVVTLQEGPPEEQVARFAKALGMHYAYFPGGWGGDKAYPGGFPGAVVTRFKVEESENRPSAGEPHDETLFTRHLGRAKLATPVGPLHVISAHFHASDHEVRMREARAIIELITQLHESAPVLLQGDLNHTPEDPEYAVWVEAGLVDVGKAKGIGNTPTFSSTKPGKRIDYIWATAEVAETARQAQVLNKPPFVPEPDDPASYALSDHMPVMAEFGMEAL